MQKVQFIFSCNMRLTYELNNTHTTGKWISLFSKMNGKFLLRSDINHRHGFAEQDEIKARAARLAQCAGFLGYPLGAISRGNWHAALNNLHLNFPGFFGGQLSPEKFHAAHEMNLLIHWLEYELANFYNGRNQYIFNLDFNHHAPAYDLKSSIPDDEFNQFSTELMFGNLHLHYIYIGRHFLEMFDAKDMVCRPKHFRAQHEFNATCGMVFSEPQDEELRSSEMQIYYHQRGGKGFFGFEFDDPKLVKGFFKLGQLQNINEYAQPERREALRQKIKKSHVVGWRFLP